MNGRLRLFTHTLGCRVNQVETQALRERLLDGGAVAVSDWPEADLCVVNTCTVTRAADQEALRLVRRIRRGNPSARLVVTGCLATRSPGEIRRAAPEALIVGNSEKDSIPALVGCGAAPTGYSVSELHGRTRAFVKVQDGCNMRCAYCVIPSIRPAMWTKPLAGLEAEVRALIGAGKREIVLCGVRLGRYLDDSGLSDGRRTDFVGMLRRVLSVPGEFRVRLSSFEVTDVTARFLELYREFPGRLCPYLHAPLQSGCDETLKAMERWYSAEFYRRRIEAAREAVPELSLFTDVMAAFPGETEAHHEASLRYVERLGFSGLHVFRFSARRGTPAARRRALPEAVVERRSVELRALDRRLRAAFARRETGKVRTALVESANEGRTEHFLRVSLAGPSRAGELVPVRVLDGAREPVRAEFLA